MAVDRRPVMVTLGAARVGSNWQEIGAAEDLELDLDL